MVEKPYRRALVWLRRDLRLHDHRPLALATEMADETYVLFVYDTVILGALTDKEDKRLVFIHDSLDEVAAGLPGMAFAHGDPESLIPRLCREWGIDALFFGHDDDPYALRRDAAVCASLSDSGIKVHSLKDHVIFERREILNQSGEPFRVYTPYSKAWMSRLGGDDIAEAVPDLDSVRQPTDLSSAQNRNFGLAELGFLASDLWLEPGSRAGQERLARFAEDGLQNYGTQRNFPEPGTTSGLSVHLRFGTVSIRECVRTALAQPDGATSQWLKELIWREFYHMILSCFPHVVGGAFRPEYDALEWPGDPDHLDAWKQGMTGYPLIDAAMRCLNQTGWMHNRLRMAAAMFLTKDLLLDWRLGEAYFAEKLLDYELASNNGGWQWSASTGCDAQPYFRVFNPILQSRRFVPTGDFIREWVPELASIAGDDIHWPHDSLFAPDYPAPLVDHHIQKEKAIALFRRDS